MGPRKTDVRADMVHPRGGHRGIRPARIWQWQPPVAPKIYSSPVYDPRQTSSESPLCRNGEYDTPEPVGICGEPMQNAYPSFHEFIPLFLSTTHASIITGMAAYSSLLRYCDFLYLFREFLSSPVVLRSGTLAMLFFTMTVRTSQVPACIS